MDTVVQSSEMEIFSNINATLLTGGLLFYILRRSYKSNRSGIDFIKKRVMILGSWLLKLAILFSFLFTSSITYLSFFMDINRFDIELFESKSFSYILKIKDYEIDLGVLNQYFYRFSCIFMVSAIFLAIPLCDFNDFRILNPNSQNYESSSSSFSKIWAILRIPLFAFSGGLEIVLSRSIFFFLKEVISCLEYFMIVMLLFFNNSNNRKANRSSVENNFLLSISTFLYGIFKHAINLIDLPFEVKRLHFHILMFVQLVLNAAIYISLAVSFYPLDKPVINPEDDYKQVNDTEFIEGNSAQVTLVESLIELHES